MIRFSFQKIPVAAWHRTDCGAPVGGGGPGPGATVVQAGDDGSSGDHSSEDREVQNSRRRL